MEPPPHPETIHTLLALTLVSVLSLSGSLTVVLGKRLQALLRYLVGAAAGALLGIAFGDLIPEAVEATGTGPRLGLLLTAGFLGSFLLERVLSSLFQSDDDVSAENSLCAELGDFHHAHEHSAASGRPLVANILFGGAIHSFIDGIAIATGFTVSLKLGVAATIAVLLHEVPHHVANVAVLIFGGLSKLKAVLWNLLAGSGCLIGGALVLLLGRHVTNLPGILLPVTATNFLYIAGAILVPELQTERNGWRSVKQVFCLAAGVALMFGLSGLLKD